MTVAERLALVNELIESGVLLAGDLRSIGSVVLSPDGNIAPRKGHQAPRLDDEHQRHLDLHAQLMIEMAKEMSEPRTISIPSSAFVQCDCGGERARTTHSHWCSTNS